MKRLIGSALAMLAAIGAAQADEFASRKITIVVPYAAGGAMDAVGRLVGEQLHQRFGVITVVDNRVGANGVLGMTYVAKASPDGYTLMISSEVGQAIQPAIDPSFPLDSLNTFTPVSLVGTFPHFLVARKGLNVNSVAEFLTHARANPGKLNFGSNGVGTIAHVGMELLKMRAGLDIANIPYRGAMAAMTDLIAGRVDANIQSLPNMASQLENPSLKILAILSGERDSRFPDIPIMIESGFPGFVFVSWTAVFGPPGMPPDIVAKIAGSLSEGVKTPRVGESLRNLGFDAVGLTASELDAFQRSVADNWKKIAQETGIKMQR